MITSRGTGRWILPKGWPMKGKKPHEAAAQEALEEAGLKGRVAPAPIGSYVYDKHDEDKVRQCKVKVYPLRVKRQLKAWPEKGQRKCLWCTPLQAASLASDEGLRPTLAALQKLLASKCTNTPAVN